jgi:hypothetical protein
MKKQGSVVTINSSLAGYDGALLSAPSMHVHHAFAGRMPEQNRCQSRILAIDITNEGFAWAMAHGCASHPERGMDAQEGEALKSRSPVRCQWDPERDLHHRPLEYRAIQPSGTYPQTSAGITAWDRAPNTAKSHKVLRRGAMESEALRTGYG